jgi:methionyl-tRNA synthetase
MASRHSFHNWVECPVCHEEQMDDDHCEYCGADLHPDTGDRSNEKYYEASNETCFGMQGLGALS